MTEVRIIGNRLKIEILGWHKLWCFKSRLDLPLEHVVGVKRLYQRSWREDLGLQPEDVWKSARMPGTYLPGVITAGSYYVAGKWFFWDVCKMDRATVIELTKERYTALIIETADPDETIARIRATVRC